MQASSDMTKIILASVGLAEPPPPPPTTTTQLMLAAAVPIDTNVVMPASCSAECAVQAVITSERTAPASSSLSSTATVAELAAPTCFNPEKDPNHRCHHCGAAPGWCFRTHGGGRSAPMLVITNHHQPRDPGGVTTAHATCLTYCPVQ